MKRYIALIVAAMLMITVLAPAVTAAAPRASRPITVRLNGKKLDWDKSSVIVDGQTMMPMEELLKSLSKEVDLKVPEVAPSARAQTTNSGDWVTGELIWLEIPAVVIDGKIHIPLRFVAESMGAEVRWDAAQWMIVIEFPSSKPNPPPKPPATNPVSMLTHTILRSGNDLYLVVKNPTARPIKMTFRSGMTHDFALIDARGRQVWRASDGQIYTQAIREETLAAGQTLIYQSTLPANLNAGQYTVRAYFPPAGTNQVAAARLEISRPNDASRLTFELTHRPAGNGFGNDYDRLAFQIMNRTGRSLSVQYPDKTAFRLVVKSDAGRQVWEYSGTNWGGELRETVAAGSTRFHAIRLPSLARGRYIAEAYFPPAGNSPVASVSFTIK